MITTEILLTQSIKAKQSKANISLAEQLMERMLKQHIDAIYRNALKAPQAISISISSGQRFYDEFCKLEKAMETGYKGLPPFLLKKCKSLLFSASIIKYAADQYYRIADETSPLSLYQCAIDNEDEQLKKAIEALREEALYLLISTSSFNKQFGADRDGCLFVQNLLQLNNPLLVERVLSSYSRNNSRTLMYMLNTGDPDDGGSLLIHLASKWDYKNLQRGLENYVGAYGDGARYADFTLAFGDYRTNPINILTLFLMSNPDTLDREAQYKTFKILLHTCVGNITGEPYPKLLVNTVKGLLQAHCGEKELVLPNLGPILPSTLLGPSDALDNLVKLLDRMKNNPKWKELRDSFVNLRSQTVGEAFVKVIMDTIAYNHLPLFNAFFNLIEKPIRANQTLTKELLALAKTKGNESIINTLQGCVNA